MLILTAALVAFGGFVLGTVIGGRFARHLDEETRTWLFAALGMEVVVLVVLSILAGTGVLDYRDNTKLILIAGLAMAFGAQNATAAQFGVQELSTTVLTSTIVGHRIRQQAGGRNRSPREAALLRGADHVRGSGASVRRCHASRSRR